MPDRRITAEAREIGRRMKSLRVELGLRAEQVAYRLHMSAGNYGHYEAGRNRLSALDLPRFAEALGVSTQVLTDRLQLTSVASEPEPPTTHAMTELYEFFRSNPDLTDAATDLALFTTGQPLSEDGVRAIIYTYKAVKALENEGRQRGRQDSN